MRAQLISKESLALSSASVGSPLEAADTSFQEFTKECTTECKPSLYLAWKKEIVKKVKEELKQPSKETSTTSEASYEMPIEERGSLASKPEVLNEKAEEESSTGRSFVQVSVGDVIGGSQNTPGAPSPTVKTVSSMVALFSCLGQAKGESSFQMTLTVDPEPNISWLLLIFALLVLVSMTAGFFLSKYILDLKN